MDKDIRDGLEKRAKELGFDSAQAYVRFWAKAEVDSRKFYIGEPEQMTPQMEKIAADVMREIAAGEVSPAFNNAQDAIDYLDNVR